MTILDRLDLVYPDNNIFEAEIAVMIHDDEYDNLKMTGDDLKVIKPDEFYDFNSHRILSILEIEDMIERKRYGRFKK